MPPQLLYGMSNPNKALIYNICLIINEFIYVGAFRDYQYLRLKKKFHKTTLRPGILYGSEVLTNE